jgi:hypothetical protein
MEEQNKQPEQEQTQEQQIKNQIANQLGSQLAGLPQEQRKAVEKICGSLVDDTLKCVESGEVKLTGNVFFDSLKLLKHVGKKASSLKSQFEALEQNQNNQALTDGSGENQSTETGPVQPTAE